MANKIGTGNRVTQADLDAKQARIACALFDNGRTPGSSASNFGSVDFVRYSWPLESKGLSLHGLTDGEGTLLGPTAGWTQQFTDNTAENGKAGIDLTRWVPYFNDVIAQIGKSEKTCAAYAVYPAFTWRAVKVTSVDPCFQAGKWSLCRTDLDASEGNEITVFPVLPEEQIIKAWCREVEVKGELQIEWYALNEDTEEFEEIEWPTWEPYQGAPPEKIPFDCWIDCTEKFDPIIAPDAVSSCNAYDVVFLCAFEGEPLEDLSNQTEELALYQWDCDGERITEIYTLDTYNQSLLPNADPLDPESQQWVAPEGAVIASCDGSVFQEPEIPSEEKTDPSIIGCPDPCRNGSTYINGRPPASNSWTWGQYTGANLVDFEAALTAAGYTVTSFGEKHQICPPFGAFGEDADAQIDNGIAVYSATVEPNINPAFVPNDLCAEFTTGKNDALRDGLLKNIADSTALSAAKNCLMEEHLNPAAPCPMQVPEDGLDKELQTLTLNGNVVANYPAGQSINLQNANGETCGAATVSSTVSTSYDEETKKTTITLQECDIDDGKSPVVITQATPVKAATLTAIKTIKTLTAVKTLVKEPVKG